MTEPYWELQPGSDVRATTIDGIGPVAVTDENVGGVIGDIAYVVSGYVYNTQGETVDHDYETSQFVSVPMRTKKRLAGPFEFPPWHTVTTAAMPRIAENVGTYTNVIEIYSKKPDLTVQGTPIQNAFLLYNLADGSISFESTNNMMSPGKFWVMTESSGYPGVTTYDEPLDPEVVAATLGGVPTSTKANLVISALNGDYCWPYLERYNLRTKRWLSRIQLPKVTVPEIPEIPEIPAGSGTPDIPGSYAFHVVNNLTTFDAVYMGSPSGLSVPQLPQLAGHDVIVTRYDPAFSGWAEQDIFSSNVVIASSMAIGALPDGSDYWIAVRTTNSITDQQMLDWSLAVEALAPGSHITRAPGYQPGTPSHPSIPAVPAVPAHDMPYASECGIAGVINGKLYFGGGDGDNIIGTEFFVYDPVTGVFTRLIDFPADDFPDYNPYGVFDNKLWYFGYNGNVAYSYDPAGSNQWIMHTTTGLDLGNEIGDPAQGVELNGKLYFVYDRVYVFDPITLTVVTKSAPPQLADGPNSSFAIDGKILTLTTDPTRASYVYTLETDTWESSGDVNPPWAYYNVGVLYHKTPYVLSGLLDNFKINTVVGVYGLTGTHDPHNHRNPKAEENRFTGLYPDNTYPLVDGHLDIEQEKRLQARQESDWARGVRSTHPSFTTKGPGVV